MHLTYTQKQRWSCGGDDVDVACDLKALWVFVKSRKTVSELIHLPSIICPFNSLLLSSTTTLPVLLLIFLSISNLHRLLALSPVSRRGPGPLTAPTSSSWWCSGCTETPSPAPAVAGQCTPLCTCLSFAFSPLNQIKTTSLVKLRFQIGKPGPCRECMSAGVLPPVSESNQRLIRGRLVPRSSSGAT